MKRAMLASIVGLSFLCGTAICAAIGQRRHYVSVPSGTEIQIRLSKRLDTASARTGERFSGTVARPLVVNGQTIFRQGDGVSGRVISAVSSGRLKRPASITLQLTRASEISLSTQPLRIDGKSHLLRNTALIGGGAGVGALVGALAGGSKGAAIGAAIGVGAGTATAYLTGKKEIVLPAELLLTFTTSVYGTGTSSDTYRTGTAYASSSQRRFQGERSDTEGESYGVGRESRGEAPRSPETYGESAPYFTPRDQQIIRSYFAESMSNLPPGLAKRGGNLPPGLERQLQRNGTLPPGLQKRIEPFPPDLEQQLSPVPAGYSRVILGTKALIINTAYRILDIISTRE